MEGKEENQETCNSSNIKEAKTSTRTSSSEDPDQEAPTTSTESEEATSAESAPAESSLATNSDNIQQLDKNLDVGGKAEQENKSDNKEGNKETTAGKSQHQSEDDDSDDDEEAVLESSPCGRWHKRKEQVFLKFYKKPKTKLKLKTIKNDK